MVVTRPRVWRRTEVVLSCWILTAQWHQKGLMHGVENLFKMLLLGLKRPHCGMRFQQPRTTSQARNLARKQAKQASLPQ